MACSSHQLPSMRTLLSVSLVFITFLLALIAVLGLGAGTWICIHAILDARRAADPHGSNLEVLTAFGIASVPFLTGTVACGAVGMMGTFHASARRSPRHPSSDV